MAGLSFENGLRLHRDSILLFKNNSYTSFLFMSVLAIEEIGKTELLMDMLYHSYSSGVWDSNQQKNFLKLVYCHKSKQVNFARLFDSPFPSNNFFKDLNNGDTDLLKQNSMYVGLKKVKGEIHLKSKIINPLKTPRLKVEKHITKVNDCLLELVLSVIQQCSIMDSGYIEEKMNKRLYKELKSNWSIVSPKTQSILKKQK